MIFSPAQIKSRSSCSTAGTEVVARLSCTPMECEVKHKMCPFCICAALVNIRQYVSNASQRVIHLNITNSKYQAEGVLFGFTRVSSSVN